MAANQASYWAPGSFVAVEKGETHDLAAGPRGDTGPCKGS